MLDTIEIGLQFFADGGAEGSASGNGGNGNGNGLSGDMDADIERYFGVRPSPDAGGGNDGESGNGDEGSVTEAQEPQEAASTGQQEGDADAEFESLIKGKYKDQFGKRTQGIINERFKKSKETENQLQGQLKAYRGMVAPLLDKYGLGDDATPEQLADAIKGDNANFSRQAMQAGIPTDAYRENFYANQAKKAEEQAKAEQAAAQQAAQQQQARDAAIRETYGRWMEQTKELKKQFPQFDLEAEVKGNERFRTMLEGGASVQEAYYGANFEKIASGLVAATRQQSMRDGAAAVAQNRARPSEGGQATGTGIRTGTDVANMTGDQIMALIDRAARGERIVL